MEIPTLDPWPFCVMKTMKTYVYKERTVKEQKDITHWLEQNGWRSTQHGMIHPALKFSWSVADAERLQKEAEGGNKAAQELLEQDLK